MGRSNPNKIGITNADIVTTRTHVGFKDKSGVTKKPNIKA